MTSAAPDDIHYMRYALRLAEQGLGRTFPNPSVGCVIVRDGHVIAASRTSDGGRPHAETEALAQVGRQARGSTVYVTLEPCAHHGQTKPCADALIQANVKRVVVAVRDPFEEVNGKSIQKLRNSGIEVTEGVCEDEAYQLNLGFFLKVTRKRPMVTLKLASTLDGKIASSTGKSEWITGGQARGLTHLLRAKHDAVMVGIGTVLQDDPLLTCRLPGLEDQSPLRVILDSKLRTPEKAKCVLTANEVPTHIFTTRDTNRTARSPAITHFIEADPTNHVDLHKTLEVLTELGVTRLLVEGGSTLAASLLQMELVDRIVWFHAPKIMGGKGLPAVASMNSRFENAALKEAAMFEMVTEKMLGEDHVMMLRRPEAPAPDAQHPPQ